MNSDKFHRGQRKQLFVDRKVQGALLLRAAGYWAFCLLTITLMLLCWRIVTGPARMFYMHFDDMWFHFGPALLASLLLLPMVLVDLLRVSNRFVGPMVRLRRMARDMAEGKSVRPVVLRDGDFWQDFAKDLNAAAARMERLVTDGKTDAISDQSAHDEADTEDADDHAELATGAV